MINFLSSVVEYATEDMSFAFLVAFWFLILVIGLVGINKKGGKL